jgi:hypothetical protein
MYVLWPYVSGAYWSLLPAAAGVCCLLVPPAGVCCWRLLRGLWLLVCFACCCLLLPVRAVGVRLLLLLLVCFCPKLVYAVSVSCLLPAGAGVILDGVLLDGACGCQCVLLEFAAG